MSGDRNFDDLAEHFERRIYGGLKGRVRLAILRRELQPYLERTPPHTEPLSVLDTGAGLAQLALELAGAGHRVTVNDLSQRMLDEARRRAEQQGVTEAISWRRGPFQDLVHEQQYDLVLCHAVLEWMAEPHAAIAALASLVRPGGHLSLAFYNRDAQIFRNRVRGTFKKVQSGEVHGAAGGLTPLHPLASDDVSHWLADAGFRIDARAGIRVFRDYVTTPMGGHLDDDAVVAMELDWSRREPFWRLGRYIHFLCRKD